MFIIGLALLQGVAQSVTVISPFWLHYPLGSAGQFTVLAFLYERRIDLTVLWCLLSLCPAFRNVGGSQAHFKGAGRAGDMCWACPFQWLRLVCTSGAFPLSWRVEQSGLCDVGRCLCAAPCLAGSQVMSVNTRVDRWLRGAPISSLAAFSLPGAWHAAGPCLQPACSSSCLPLWSSPWAPQ